MSFWQIIGIISLCTVLALGLAILLRNPRDHTRSISSFVATKPHYFLAMALSLTVGGAAFYGFLIFWLIPTHEMPSVTYWIIGIAFVAQLGIAWTRASHVERSWANRVHTIGGIIVGSAMVVCIWLLVLYGRNLTPITYAVTTFAAISTIICFIVLLIGIWRYKQLIFISEAAMIGVFSIAMLVLAIQL